MADTADSPITLTLPRSVFEGIAAALEANRPPKRPVRLGLLKALVGASGGMLDFEKLTESTTTKTQVASIEGVENAPARTVIHEDIHQEHHCSTIPRLPLPTSTARAAIVIVGCGEIARNYVHSILHAPDFVITAVCDPDVASATALASIINAHQALVYSPIQPCFVAKSLDEVLEIHASQRRIAVNLTPTHLHYSTTTKLLVGGCNVWSEKPLAETVEEAQKLLGLAADRSLELGCSPVTFWGAAQQTVSEQVRNGALGPVRLCTASVLCGSWMSMDDRLGGWRAHRRYQVGSLRDVAVYPFALLTSLFGPALAISARAAGRASLHHSQTETAELNARQSQSSSPQKASDLESSALDPTHNVPWAGVDGGKENVDLWTITIDLAGGITVLITSSLSLSAPAASDAYTLTIRGDKGIISLDSLWNGGANITFIQEGGLEEAGRPQSLSLWMPHAEHPNAPPHPHSCDWSLGLKLLASSIDARMCAVDDPSMSTHELPRDSPPLPNRTFTGDHGLHIVDMLQQAEKSADAPDHPALPLTTKFQWPPPMPPQSQICSVKFCGHQMSMLIFGTMRLANVTQPLDLLDAAWNCGCNTFDMGHVYGPKVEGILGKWLSSRIGTGRGSFLRPPAPGRTLTRSDVILIAKGGHPFRESKEGARLKQEDLSRDLDESLERLHTDYVDVFLLHRDDPKAFPKVGFVVEAVVALIRSGKTKAWGTSNWHMSRVQTAIAFCDEHKLPRPVAVSDQYSLATPSRPVWDGCCHLTEESAVFYDECGIRVLAWAPLAEGYLCSALARSESTQCWDTQTNRFRRERLCALARARGLTVSEVALAYALQSGAAAVVVGTSTISRLHDAVRATSLQLTASDVTWLKDGTSYT